MQWIANPQNRQFESGPVLQVMDSSVYGNELVC